LQPQTQQSRLGVVENIKERERQAGPKYAVYGQKLTVMLEIEPKKRPREVCFRPFRSRELA
jgi:hypothetical protein